MIYNLLHADIHFATQFNLTTPFRKFPVGTCNIHAVILIFYCASTMQPLP